jgi:hypothetical protein
MFPTFFRRRFPTDQFVWAFGNVSGTSLHHACAHADELYRRCVINGESPRTVARRLKLSQSQAEGVVRIVRRHGRRSPERMALVAMRDWGLDNQDIAEMFGRSVKWASVVREQADEIRLEEFIQPALEYLDTGLVQGDPAPEEILRIAAELRAKRPHNTRMDYAEFQVGAA